MTESTARLSLPLLMPAQAQKHVTHNEALQLLDALTQLVLSGVGLNQPPASPVDGACYGVGAAPVGDWIGQAGKIARRSGAGWQFITPQEGWAAWDTVDQASKIYHAGQWVSGGGATQNLAGLGIQTTSDAVNRLAVSSDASLFTHDGADHQLKINKALAGDTASILFQTGWTGHAEFGLSGNNSFSVKVSADGATWQTALTADPAAGTLALGLPVTGAAVQSGPADATAGKILTTGAFGWGTAAAPILVAARALGRPTALYLRELPETDLQLCRDLALTPAMLREAVLTEADRIIANSQTTLNWIGGDNAILAENRINLSLFDLPARAAGPLRIGLVGSGTPRKGLLDFLRIAQALGAETGLKFVLVGPLPQLPLPPNVHAVGFAETPAKAIAHCDIVLSLSHFAESFGRTIAEAMAAGRPVIAYDHGHPSELLKNGGGILVPRFDWRSAARQIRRIARDRALYERLSVEGRAAARPLAEPWPISLVERIFGLGNPG